MSARSERVLAVVGLGPRLASVSDPLGIEARHALLATSGLSKEGVERALGRHLETGITDDDLGALLASVEEAPCCWVVLSANVCTAALRAVALALAASPRVRLRPSRRDPALAPILARALQSRGLDVTLVDALDPAPPDTVHAYGADETLRVIAASLPPGVRQVGHGTGLGAALIEADADLDEAAPALAEDVIAFDQRGCLSPRFALVDGDEQRATSFATGIHRSLLALGAAVPRGPLDEGTAGAIAMYRAATEAVGPVFAGAHHLVSVDGAPRTLMLPPAARVLLVAAVRAPALAGLLAPWAPYLTTLGVTGRGTPREGTLLHVARSLAPDARVGPLGSMQRPPLDGPVDRRAWPRSPG